MNHAHRDKRTRIEHDALEAVTNRAAVTISRAELREAQSTLNWLAMEAHRAYNAAESPKDAHGNPTDYSGAAHQTMLRLNEIDEQLTTAADIIEKLLDSRDFR